jgi:hypothetical protein
MMGKKKKAPDNKPPGIYTLTRFNATRHGILSKHTLLPWESREEYEEVYSSLRQEHIPKGPTEEHLVEEIAGIFWRKRRLRMAETAAFQERMYRERVEIGNPEESDDFIKWEFPNIADQLFGLAFNMNSEDWARSLKLPMTDKLCTQAALKILNAGGHKAFQRALETLPINFRQDWEKGVAEGKYSSNHEELSNYIVEAYNYAEKFVDFIYDKSSNMARSHGAIFNPERLDNLSRYEVFLDRKLERILSMLLKIQALRREREKVEQVIE